MEWMLLLMEPPPLNHSELSSVAYKIIICGDDDST